MLCNCACVRQEGCNLQGNASAFGAMCFPSESRSVQSILWLSLYPSVSFIRATATSFSFRRTEDDNTLKTHIAAMASPVGATTKPRCFRCGFSRSWIQNRGTSCRILVGHSQQEHLLCIANCWFDIECVYGPFGTRCQQVSLRVVVSSTMLRLCERKTLYADDQRTAVPSQVLVVFSIGLTFY